MVGFDVRAVASTKKSCGTGCDWLVQDKRYFTLMLLKHIEALAHDASNTLPAEVRAWYEKAKAAAQEYAGIEKRLYPVSSVSSTLLCRRLLKRRNREG